MKIFIDSADVQEIKDAAAMGVVDGVTTNPSLVSKTGKPMNTVIAEICELIDGPVSAEVLSTDVEGIVREGKALAAIHPRLVFDSAAKAHVLNSGKVKDCLDRNREALDLYEKAAEMGQTGLDFEYKLEDARARVKRLEGMYKTIKMMETDQTLEEIGAPRE